ncbi:MAG: threonine synthase [Clostridia bacterium]
MRYLSTRNNKIDLTSAQAIAKGLSDDGGLFCPESIPAMQAGDIEMLCKTDYQGRTQYVFDKFLTDFTADEIANLAKNAYGEKFDTKEIAPVVKTGDTEFILELFRGPTCAFKDMALQMLPHLMTASLAKTNEQRTACILVATSGDTGKAALEGFADVPQTKIMVFYPENGVSDVQKLQMATQKGANVSVCAIDGNFDDAQSAVKVIFSDDEIAKKLDAEGLFLSSANSINWGRLVPQIIYYISAYCDMVNAGEIAIGDAINVCVPTGNFGNILAAYFAKNMGINIGKLICASNSNNVLTDFFKKDGEYDKNREFFLTNSPSMDILISSNLERLLFIASEYNSEFVCDMMNSLKTDGKYKVPAEIFSKIGTDFDAGFCDEKETNATIAEYLEKTGYLLDTHTAVAVKVYKDYKEATGDTTKTVIASTASPFKFADSVLSAIGEEISENGLENLDLLAKRTNLAAPKSLAELKDLEVRFTKSIKKETILDEALTLINL